MAALIPLITFVYGIGLAAKTLAVIMLALPVIVLNGYKAVRNANPSLVAMCRSFQGTRMQQITKVIIPDASPVIFAGLRRAGVLGINRRNACYTLRWNARHFYPLVDDKLATKRLCQQAGIPVPALLAVARHHFQIRHVLPALEARDSFVLKPVHGALGNGIVVVTGRSGELLVRAGGRTLRHEAGFPVRGVMYFTDVDDRTILESGKAGIPLREYTDTWVKAFLEDAASLGLEEIEERPRATDEANLRAMSDMVAALEQNGHTYRSEGSIYFRIASLAEYGLLVALIAVVCIIAVAALGTNVATKIQAAADAIAG